VSCPTRARALPAVELRRQYRPVRQRAGFTPGIEALTLLSLHHLDGSIHNGPDAVKAAVSSSSEQVIVNGGFVGQHFHQDGGVLEDCGCV